MKLSTIIISMGILSSFFGCKNDNKYTDEQGNVFIEKGGETFITPAEYEKTGKIYEIYFRNESNQSVIIKSKFKLQTGEDITFKFADTESIGLDNGTKIFFGETGLEVEDKKNVLAGIGGEFWKKYNVPDQVDYGFVIVNIGEGDK